MSGLSLNISSRKLALISLIFSSTTIIILVWINNQIATQFKAASGKTRELFGFIELTYNYKYNFVGGATIGFMLAVLAIRKAETRIIPAFALIVAVASFAIIFIRIWTWMI